MAESIEDPELEVAKALMKQVYDRGINIYMMINRTKKELKRVDHFPSSVIIGVCKDFMHYHSEGKIVNNYTYFVRLLKHHSGQWHANNQIQESKKYNKRSTKIPYHISQLLRNPDNGS